MRRSASSWPVCPGAASGWPGRYAGCSALVQFTRRRRTSGLKVIDHAGTRCVRRPRSYSPKPAATQSRWASYGPGALHMIHAWLLGGLMDRRVFMVVGGSALTPAVSAQFIRVSTTCGWVTSSSTMASTCGRRVRASVTASSGSRNVNPRAGATANQDWIAHSLAVQAPTAPASRIRPPTSSDGDCSVRRHPPRGTGDGSPPRPATVDRRTQYTRR
jgi:hypothetical protein